MKVSYSDWYFEGAQLVVGVEVTRPGVPPVRREYRPLAGTTPNQLNAMIAKDVKEKHSGDELASKVRQYVAAKSGFDVPDDPPADQAAVSPGSDIPPSPSSAAPAKG